MRFGEFSILGITLLVSPMLAPTAQAASCQAESPNAQVSGSVWTQVPANAVPASLQNKILVFLGSLEGHWQGTGGTTACVMNDANAIPVRASERVKLTVTRNGQASFDFHFSIYDTQNNVSTTYNFILDRHGQALQVTGEGNLDVSQFYDGSLRFRTQTAMRTGFKRKFGKGSANTVLSLETVRQLTLNDGELSFYKAVFHNGAIIDYSHWTFQHNY